MASIDIFGKPIQGETHSIFYNKLVSSKNKLTVKQKYESEKKKVDQFNQDQEYKQRLREMQQQRLHQKLSFFESFFKQ